MRRDGEIDLFRRNGRTARCVDACLSRHLTCAPRIAAFRDASPHALLGRSGAVTGVDFRCRCRRPLLVIALALLDNREEMVASFEMAAGKYFGASRMPK